MLSKSRGGVEESMDLQRILLVSALILLVLSSCRVKAGDIVHDDEKTPKKPGCANDFVLVYQILIFFFYFLFAHLLFSSFLGLGLAQISHFLFISFLGFCLIIV